MSRRIRVKDCAGCPYHRHNHRHNRGKSDWCENVHSPIREISFCAWNEWNRMKREEKADEVHSP